MGPSPGTHRVHRLDNSCEIRGCPDPATHERERQVLELFVSAGDFITPELVPEFDYRGRLEGLSADLSCGCVWLCAVLR